MNEKIVESMKSLEQISGCARGIIGCVRNNILHGLINQREYEILLDFYTKLYMRAIDLGEKDVWITLSKNLDDAVFLLNRQYN